MDVDEIKGNTVECRECLVELCLAFLLQRACPSCVDSCLLLFHRHKLPPRLHLHRLLKKADDERMKTEQTDNFLAGYFQNSSKNMDAIDVKMRQQLTGSGN